MIRIFKSKKKTHTPINPIISFPSTQIYVVLVHVTKHTYVKAMVPLMIATARTGMKSTRTILVNATVSLISMYIAWTLLVPYLFQDYTL